jgi:hypothetical protein
MENKKITKLFLEFYPVYGLALGFTYFSNDQEEEEIIEYGKAHTLQFLILFFGISLNWNMK